MEITEVRIHLRNEEKLKAYATITFDKCFVVRDLKIIQGNNGMFVAMPSRKRPDGTFKDIAHPLDNDTRRKIESKILEAYKAELLKLKDQVHKVDEAAITRTQDMNKKLSDIEKSIENKISG
jgi:stage V sporulation protein G